MTSSYNGSEDEEEFLHRIREDLNDLKNYVANNVNTEKQK